jgi:hypothetical protein
LDRQNKCLVVPDDPCGHYGLRSRWAVIQGAVWPEGVVFHSPTLDEYLSFLEGIEDLSVQQFVAEFLVETFTVAVFPRATRLDVEGPYPCSLKPLSYRRSSEF